MGCCDYPVTQAGDFIPARAILLIFAATWGELRPHLGLSVMKLWMRERDQLIEQTRAFVEGVAALQPARSEPAPTPEPSRPVAAVKPATAIFLGSERAEIEQRVANFKAQQQKFQRAREAHYHAIISETRATPRNQAPG